MMKEGWTYKKLGEVCEILDSRRKPITKSKRESGSIPYYGATGLLDYVKDYIFDEKLVLLGEDGAKWGAGENSSYIIEGKTWVNNHAHTLRPKRDVLIDEFLVYYLNYSNLLPYITGVTVPKLNQEKMRSIEIPIGSLNKQRSIISRLDAAFADIDALKANADKQLSEARQLFQAELTECMKLKEGWKEKKIKEVGEVIGGTTPSTNNPEFWGGDICWISPAELHGEHYLYDSVKKITQKAVIAKSLKELPIGTVILSSRAPIGKLAINKVPMYCNQGFKCIACGPELYNEFLYWWLYGNTDYLNSIGTGATFPEISKAVVENIVIPVAPLDTQHQIVDRLDSLSSRIKQLEEVQRKTMAECNALKQALLREIFE